MANKRSIKKDVNYLTDEFLADSFALMAMYDEKNDEKIIDSMQKVADARNKFVFTIQHADDKGKRLSTEERKNGRRERSKVYKKKLNKEFVLFVKSLEDGYEVLGKLSTKAE